VHIVITLVSSDQSIVGFCRELVAEVLQEEGELKIVSPDESYREHASDLYLLDFLPGVELPADAAWGQTHFVLMRQKDVPTFQTGHPGASASILLKPITKHALRSVFEQTIVSKRNRSPQNLKSLRIDRDELLQCVIQANLKLQEYDQQRTNFLTRAVHDFRAPVTALSGYCGLLLEGQLGPLTVPQKEVLQRMLNSSKRLGRMANGMLQLSVSRHLEQQPNLRPTDIFECVEQALHEVNQFINEKNIKIGVELEPAPGPLLADPGQMEQLLVNLLDNACKFTPRNNAIYIKGYPYVWDAQSPNLNQIPNYALASQTPNAYRVDIQDSGSGIKLEHLNSIFEDYTSYSSRDERAGAGLGLAICKMIITHHKGKIWAETRPEGASFSFILPLDLESGSMPSAAAALQSTACH
jgi:signal transduction histidine kinase